jgi:hypothetical protein
MIYKFKSRAAADLLMTGPVGDRVLSLMGKERTPQGIIDADQVGAAIAALEAAVAGEEGDRPPAGAEASDRVSLRQRVWPMIEMLKAAQAEKQPVVWGV